MAIIKNMLAPHDAWGPEMVLAVSDPESGLQGVLVIDNTALGPGKGGIRMMPDVTEEEVRRLARTMTWKNALAGIPFGGAKAGIRFSTDEGVEKKKLYLTRFAQALKPFLPKRYIAGPDVNTGEHDMKTFVDAAGNWRAATGKPANVCMAAFGTKGGRPRRSRVNPGSRGKCGIPHEFGSTGFGVAEATRVAAEFAGIPLKGARVAVDGFGNVGSFTCRYLHEMGALIVAVADRDGATFSENGIAPKDLEALRNAGKSIRQYQGGKALSREAFFTTQSDILIPASVTDIIHHGNKKNIKTRIIVEGANIPMRENVEEELFRRNILIVPDFVANAGGVISSYAEYRGYNPKRMFSLVRDRITTSVKAVLKESGRTGTNPRTVALRIAEKRVAHAMKKRRLTFS